MTAHNRTHLLNNFLGGTRMKLASICRTKEIRGHEFPAIIRNGPCYFLINLQVFADGLVNCWQMVDLPIFKEKLRRGWVVTSIPEKEALNIHGIGITAVNGPEWVHTPKSLVGFVEEVVMSLNPRLENLYDCHGRDTYAVNTDNPRPWKTDQPISPLVHGMFGASLHHFHIGDGSFHLVNIQLFKDDSAIIFGRSEPVTLPFNELVQQLEKRDRFRLPERGDQVVIDGLVKFTCGDWDYRVEPNALLAEFHDLHDRVHGRPGAIQECVRAYEHYMAEPSSNAMEALRQKYEAVPEHLRMYCGDMDTKDIPIRMILYGKGEIENWSHYQLAKQLGQELPSITIPEPPKEP